MNRESEFDLTLKDWLDAGSDHAPERFIWAAMDDVERAAQRGAWRVSLEDRLVSVKPLALALVTAAAIIAAFAGYQLIAGPNVGNPGPRPTPQPTAVSFSAVELPSIVLTADNAPEGIAVDSNEFGLAAWRVPLRPGGPEFDLTAFVDGRMTNLNSTETGGYVSWAALFETSADSELAFEYIVDEHGSSGWQMTRSTVDPGLGEESASFTGAAYDLFPTNEVYIWRVGNLVLAAVGVGDFDAGQLRSIADLMDGRTE